MSSRKSFDIGPSRPAASRRKPAPPEKPVRRRKTSARRNARAVAEGKGKTLRARRREARNRTGVIVLFIFVVVSGLGIYGLWRPEVRITSVKASGMEGADALAPFALKALGGTYYGIIPRNSFFLYPEDEVRASILSARPDVAAVSLSRTGFNSLSIRVIGRTTAFLWCGTVASSNASCYLSDAEGLIFAPQPVETATTTQLRVFASVDTASSTGSYPLRARVVGTSSLPNILRFVKAVNSFGVTVVSVSIRDDEADLYAASGTRITYVIGREEAAANAAKAALPSLDFKDGSLEYVDLRFTGKVYLKRKDDKVAS